MKWFGHVVRMPHHRFPLQAYIKITLPNEDLQVAHQHTGEDQIQGDLGVPPQEAEHQAQGRTEWRRMTRRRVKGHPVLRT